MAAWRKGLYSAGAATAGVGAVCVATSQVNRGHCPHFSPTGERFDQSTFAGRYQKMLLRCDPATLLRSEADIRKAQALLLAEKEGKQRVSIDQDGSGDPELWEARQLVESAVHPETGELIPQPFRMSGYVPYNGPICVAMIMSSGTGALLFWNWVNQSINAAVNYCNRSSGGEADTQQMLTSYAAAVGASLGIVYGLTTTIHRFAPPAKVAQLLRFTAFPACCVASSANCYIVRRPEIGTGIALMDGDGRPVSDGKLSTAAAQKAVQETVFSRCLLQVPVYFVPAVVMAVPVCSAYATMYPAGGLALSTFITITSFGVGLPAAIAYFPQHGTIRAADVEPGFWEGGEAPAGCAPLLTYNKGL